MVKRIIGGRQNDNFYYNYGGENLLIVGAGGDDTLRGSSGNDRLYGGAGNDTLYLSAGHDVLYGGTGNDVYRLDSFSGGNAQVTIVEERNGGYDRVEINTPFVSFTLPDNIEEVWISRHVAFLKGNDAANVLDVTRSYVSGGMHIEAGGGHDTVKAGSGDDKIWGGAGRDTIEGNSGADLIFGGSGNDRLYGGNGDDALYGGGGKDRLYGGAGHDVLDGGAGADIMYGGAGFDIYHVNHKGDRVIEDVNDSGFDSVIATVDYTLVAGVESLTLQGKARIGNGNDLDNVITGNKLANRLSGGGGDDILDGKAGNDLLFGGTGDDVLTGGTGKDRMTGGAGSDVFVFLAANETGRTKARADIITDFGADDMIDLSSVDANVNRTGPQGFDFIGRAGFSKTAGELRYADGFLQGDTNGDGRADLFIRLLGAPTVTEDSLIL